MKFTEQQIVDAALAVYRRTGNPVRSQEIYVELANGQEPADGISKAAGGWLSNLGRKISRGEATPIVRVVDDNGKPGWVPAGEAVGAAASQTSSPKVGVAEKFKKRKWVKLLLHQTCVFEQVVKLEYMLPGVGYVEQPSFGNMEVFMLPNVEFLNEVQAKVRGVLKIRITVVENGTQVQKEQVVPANYWVIVAPSE